MNRIFKPTADAFLFRLTNNAESYAVKRGKFRVTAANRKAKAFTTLLDAFLYYIGIDEQADLWDMTEGKVLIESKAKIFLN